MRQILAAKFKRELSLFATMALVLQSLLPISYFGNVPVFADTQTYNFNTAGEYSTDTKVTIFDGTATANFTWDTSSDSIASGDSVVDLLASTDTDGLVMATTGKGTLLRSTDYGSTWAAIIVGPSFSAKKIVQTTANDMLLVGSDTVANKIYRSTDDGASWTPSTTTFADSFVGVANDGASLGRNWAIASETGTVYVTSDSGNEWAGLAGEGLDTGGDVMWYSGNVIFASGTTGEDGALVYSTDSGSNWTDISSALPGTPATLINRIEKFGSNIFVSGTGYVAKITIASDISEVETGGNWTNLTANINANSGDDINFSTVGGILRTTTGVILLSVLDTDASEARVISSIDGGTDWHRHADPGTYIVPGDLVRLPTDGRFLWGVKNSEGTGDAEGLLSNTLGGADSLVATTGIPAVSIESIDITYHGTSEITDVGLVLGFATDDSGTWYYHNGAAWTSTTTDNVSNSMGETLFNTNIASFDEDPGISGDVYFKFYMAKQPASETISPFTNSLVTIESVAVTYTPGTITVTQPAGGEVWRVGTQHQLAWSYSAGYSPDSVDVEYSTSSGSSWATIVSGHTSTSYMWTIPNEPTTTGPTAQIRVSAGGINGTSGLFTISSSGGGPDPGCPVDTTPPTSQVQALPEYSLGNFTITVVAQDEPCGSGVKEVSLWYSFNEEPGPYEGETTLVGVDDSAPFEFTFDAPDGDGTYYFVSSAIDFAGNDNAPDKPVDQADCPFGGFCQQRFLPPPEIEAQTIVDTGKPYIVTGGQSPAYNEEGVPMSGDVVLRFSEAIDPDSFGVELIEGLNSQPPYDYLPTSEPEWSLGNTQVTFGYGLNAGGGEPPLNANTWYRLKVVGTDLAGNDLHRGAGDPHIAPLYASWAFKTITPQDPNLTGSAITVQNDDGDFSVGDLVEYRVTLVNSSNLPAYNATADLTFADGLTYSHGLTSSGGLVTLVYDPSGNPIGWAWSGQINANSQVVINYQMTVDGPTNNLDITQTVDIDDGVNAPLQKSVTIHIAQAVVLTTSTKIVEPTLTNAGGVLDYTVTVTNTGQTAGWITLTDPLPNHLEFLDGTLTGSGWDTLSYSPEQNSITAQMDSLLVGMTRSFTFSALVEDTASSVITNTATINQANPPTPLVSISATTTISDTPPPPPGDAPELIGQTPSSGAQAVGLNTAIVMRFNEPIITYTFDYTVSLVGQPMDTTGWSVVWSNANKTVTVTPPFAWDMDSTYTVELWDAQDEDGNTFIIGVTGIDNPWSFTTVYPAVQIVSPTYSPQMLQNSTTAYNPSTGQFEQLQFLVGLRDFYTGTPYVPQTDVAIGFDLSSVGAQIGLTPNFASPVTTVTILGGASETSFYYKDSEVSAPDYARITPYEHIVQGWDNVTKYVQVVSTESTVLEPHLVINLSSHIVPVNQFSQPIVIEARDEAEAVSLPPRLFFHTQSTGGAFFTLENGDLVQLPEWITIQADNPQTNLQYWDTAGLQHSATFYYLDSVAGNPLITVGDNAPLSPDIDYNNASTILTIQNSAEEEEIIVEEELEEVEDETGRLIAKVEIEPIDAYLLPNGVQTFNAVGYDQSGEEIPELKFKWYVLAGGGTIQKDGIGGDTHTSAFVADTELGAFFDTVMVATLYNGEIGYATASVFVVDITDVGGPTGLPVTGVSSLQLVFMALTLSAAVALAWVESYEKQHFSQEHK